MVTFYLVLKEGILFQLKAVNHISMKQGNFPILGEQPYLLLSPSEGYKERLLHCWSPKDQSRKE